MGATFSADDPHYVFSRRPLHCPRGSSLSTSRSVLLGAGCVDVKPLVAGIYPLERFAEAFDRAKRGLKVILTP